MADLIEVTKECSGCGQPSTYRTSKPVANVQCKHCGRGVYLGKKLIADARAALLPQRTGRGTTAAPLPDQSTEWAREQPFTRLTLRPRPDGICATCGTDTDQGSPRGTFVRCRECNGFRYDEATAERRAAAADRIDAAELAARRARAAAAERARIDQAPAPDLAEQLDLAGRIGVTRAAIAGAIRALHNAPTQALGMQAANAAARLQALDHAVSEAVRQADPYDALNALQPYLVAELRDAERIARTIGQALADIEIEEAREARHLELIERQTQAIAPPARRALTAAPSPRITTAAVSWRPCELSHRFIRPAATQVIRLTNSQYGSPEKQLAICGQHDPAKVCRGYDYSHYVTVPMAAGR